VETEIHGPRMTFCCIHCGYGIDALITRYGPSNYSLRQCQKCRNLADPYVDDAFPIKLVDLMLFKPRIFRHLLFNVEGQEDDKRLPTHKLPVVWRLGIATLLLEAYTRWSEEALFADTFSTLSDQQLWQGFLRGLLRQIGETVTLHCASYLVAYMFLRLRNRTQPKTPPFRFVRLMICIEERSTAISMNQTNLFGVLLCLSCQALHSLHCLDMAKGIHHSQRSRRPPSIDDLADCIDPRPDHIQPLLAALLGRKLATLAY